MPMHHEENVEVKWKSVGQARKLLRYLVCHQCKDVSFRQRSHWDMEVSPRQGSRGGKEVSWMQGELLSSMPSPLGCSCIALVFSPSPHIVVTHILWFHEPFVTLCLPLQCREGEGFLFLSRCFPLFTALPPSPTPLPLSKMGCRRDSLLSFFHLFTHPPSPLHSPPSPKWVVGVIVLSHFPLLHPLISFSLLPLPALGSKREGHV